MQTHENTNVVKPTMIGKKPVYKSKKYQLNILDYIKGFIVSVLSAMLFAAQQMADKPLFWQTLRYWQSGFPEMLCSTPDCYATPYQSGLPDTDL